MKKKLIKILSFVMICCISLLCVGCMGTSPDDENPMEGMAFDMYGAKVLYRPDSYDYNTGSGAAAGEVNDYYGEYSFLVMKGLFENYGIVNDLAFNLEISDDKKPFVYDSIRYQVDTFGTVTHREEDGSIEALAESDKYIVVGADFSSHWKWTFDYDLFDSKYNALLVTNDEYDVVQDSHIYNQYTNQTEYQTEFDKKYNLQSFKDFYQTALLGTANEADSANYSEYVKALEYVVYSYALDFEPKTVKVTINDNATSVNDLYQVEVLESGSTYVSVDTALANIKKTFNEIGSYVGLMERQIAKISNWIKTNIIGVGTNIANDHFTTYQNMTEVVAADGSISYRFDESNKATTNLGRSYDSAVDYIVNDACQYVEIGTGVKINQRFLASEVKEYAGNTFMILDDGNFAVPGASNSPRAIQPLEYQSVQIMLKEGTSLGSLWLALKYDADLDGTTKGEYDLSKYIDIIVELNYYNHQSNRLFTIGTQQTRIYDGPYKNLMEENKYGLPDDDHGTLFFTDFASNCTGENAAYIGSVTDGEHINIGAFKPENFPKTDVGENGYNGTPLVSTQPLRLTGVDDLRHYYSIIEPLDSELGENNTYVTGRSNPEKYADANGCDYLEITYKVLKQKNNETNDYGGKNYKFYTGIVSVFDEYKD